MTGRVPTSIGAVLPLLVLVSGAESCTGVVGVGGTPEDPRGGPTDSQGAGGSGPSGPARPSPDTRLRRLTRTEYNNTLRDLLGDRSQPGNRLAADHPYLNGIFDNDAETLSTSTPDVDTYESIANDVVEDAFRAGSASRSRVLSGCSPVAAACSRTVVAVFARRAWRRPLEGAEVDQLMSTAQAATGQGDSLEEGLKLAFRAVLVSPNFLYRVESSNTGGLRALGPYELATRLSYFLWASTPDDQLLDLAELGTVAEPDVLAGQIRRMLADGRADALTSNFAAQWLSTSAVRDQSQVAPSKLNFSTWNEDLREPMAREPELFFSEFLKGDRGLPDMLTADFTFANDRLARHYGLPAVTGAAMQRVSVGPDTHRFGLLTHAAMLTATSNSDRTSPVKRGKWVAFRMLCVPPREVPPNVPPLKDAKSAGLPASATIRDLMNGHAKPECAGCHALMDPLGFGLEQYDGIGAWRSRYKNNPRIDATGTFDGQSFDGAAQMADILKNSPGFVQCFARNMFAYALGRSPQEEGDQDALAAIGAGFAKRGLHIPDLISLIAGSGAFQKRGGQP